jgi:protease-4
MKAWQKGLLVFIVITCVVLIGSLIYASMHRSGPSFVSFSPYVAQLKIEGTIDTVPVSDYLGNVYGYNHQWTLDTIDELINDVNNQGLLIYVDSPGGGVYPTDELYLKIMEYKEECDRPIYVVMGSMAASGGYYLAAAADKIYANRNTWTGSIGVTMGTFIDVSEFLSEHGVNSETITSGRNKAMGGYFDPMTEEQKSILQGLVDEAYEQFTGIVAEGRDLPLSTVKDLADGRIYSAKQAMELDLIDEIGSVDDAFANMQEEYDLWDCTLHEISYVNTSFFGRALGGNVLSQLSAILKNSKGDIGVVLEFAEKINRMPIRYLYNG